MAAAACGQARVRRASVVVEVGARAPGAGAERRTIGVKKKTKLPAVRKTRATAPLQRAPRVGPSPPVPSHTPRRTVLGTLQWCVPCTQAAVATVCVFVASISVRPRALPLPSPQDITPTSDDSPSPVTRLKLTTPDVAGEGEGGKEA